MTNYTRIPSREQHIGKRLAILRTRLNLSDADVAQRYGLPLELLPRIETGGPVPVDVAPKIRLALADLGESQPGPVIVDAASRPADAQETPAGNTDDTPRGRGGYTQTLRDEDRALLERLGPAREARGLNASQAARQIGLTTGGYIALEAVKPNRITGATRAKLQAWLDNGTPNLSIVRDEQVQAEIEAGWREIETFAQVRPDDDLPFLPDGSPALDAAAPDPENGAEDSGGEPDDAASTVKAYVFRMPIPDTTVPKPPGPLAALLARLPAFNSAWKYEVQMRWFDSFDVLVTTVLSREDE